MYYYQLVFLENDAIPAVILTRDSLKEIDAITGDYTDSFEMIAVFNELYGKDINFTKAQIRIVSKKDSKDIKYVYDLVYKKDKIDYDKIKLALFEYLQKYPKDISLFDIKYLTKYFDEVNINTLVNSYFNEKASYSKYRKTYFKLKELGALNYLKKKNNKDDSKKDIINNIYKPNNNDFEQITFEGFENDRDDINVKKR